HGRGPPLRSCKTAGGGDRHPGAQSRRGGPFGGENGEGNPDWQARESCEAIRTIGDEGRARGDRSGRREPGKRARDAGEAEGQEGLAESPASAARQDRAERKDREGT